MTQPQTGKVRFTKPPVRSVSLSLFFQSVPGLQVSFFSSLREAWKSDYPNSAELPPLRPRNRGGEEAVIVPVSSAWPFPYVMFTTAGDQESIAFQSDRFTRTWTFSPDGEYPGFEALAGELALRFEQFSDVVKSETGEDVKVTGSSCDYSNTMPTDLTGPELLVGVVSKWTTPAGTLPGLNAEYAGVRFHLCGDDELDGCSINVALDWDEDGAYLGIESSFDVDDLESQDTPRLGGLDRAHDKLIATFVEFTSDAMHSEWGREA